MKDIQKAQKEFKEDIEKALISYHETSGEFIEQIKIDPNFSYSYFGSPQEALLRCNPIITINKKI